MTIRRFKSPSAQKTKSFAEKFAKEILVRGRKNKTAFILAMEGDLGGGKTTFLQGFAKGLGIREKVLSPTFLIMKIFKIPSKKNEKEKNLFRKFFHLDCYRINSPKEILNLGWNKIIADNQNIVAVEWSKKIKKIIPKNSILIKFDFIKKNTRVLYIHS